MRKTLVSLASLLLILMLCVSCALAEDYQAVYGHTPGDQRVNSKGAPYTILYGTDASRDDPCLTILVDYGDASYSVFKVFTKQSNILSALSDAGLVKYEKRSWGYSVITVDTIRAEYSTDGAFWAYYKVNSDNSITTIATGLDVIPVVSGDIYEFMYFVLE